MDLYLDGNDLATPIRLTANNTEAILQSIRIRLRTFLGEWFLDQRVGIPYFEDILIKNPSTNFIKSMVRNILLSTPGVLSINRLTLDFDTANRNLEISFQIRIHDGTILEASFDDLILV